MNDMQLHYINAPWKHNSSFSRFPPVDIIRWLIKVLRPGRDLEEALHMFPRSVVLHRGVRVLPHHVVDGFHDV